MSRKSVPIQNPMKCAWCGNSSVVSYVDVNSIGGSGNRMVFAELSLPICNSCKTRIDTEHASVVEYVKLSKKSLLKGSYIIGAIIGLLLVPIGISLGDIFVGLLFAFISWLFGLLISSMFSAVYHLKHPGHPRNAKFEASWGKVIATQPFTVIFTNSQFATSFASINPAVNVRIK